MADQSENPSIKQFFRSIWKDGAALMSGIFSVPFAVVAVFSDSKFAPLIWAIMAGLAIAFTVYRVWSIERRKVVKLEDKIKPKLKCTFSLNIPACFVLTNFTGSSEKIDYCRIQVTSDVIGHISGCTGRLISLTRDGIDLINSEILTLPFAPAARDDAISKSIYNGVPEYLDVLYVSSYNISITTHGFFFPNSIDAKTLFSIHGNYVFEIAVTSPDSDTVIIKLLIYWMGNRETVSISVIP